jgi:hypothetical protein
VSDTNGTQQEKAAPPSSRMPGVFPVTKEQASRWRELRAEIRASLLAEKLARLECEKNVGLLTHLAQTVGVPLDGTTEYVLNEEGTAIVKGGAR